MDHLINELDTRFDKKSSESIAALMKLLPPACVDSTTSADAALSSLLSFYEDDLPFCLALEPEFDMWRQKWRSDSQLAVKLNTPAKTLPHLDKDFYPNISVLFHIMATLPVTSCECERSISMLRLIKTPLRSTMGQDRLNGLAMLYYHRDVEITPEEVVEEFSRCHPRRLLLSNPFS